MANLSSAACNNEHQIAWYLSDYHDQKNTEIKTNVK